MPDIRLTQKEIDSICVVFSGNFTDKSHIWLFGSRVDLEKKGGDIDLYVETEISDTNIIFEKKLKFLRELKDKIGEQKIDLVINFKGSENLDIYRYAKQNGVLLK